MLEGGGGKVFYILMKRYRRYPGATVPPTGGLGLLQYYFLYFVLEMIPLGDWDDLDCGMGWRDVLSFLDCLFFPWYRFSETHLNWWWFTGNFLTCKVFYLEKLCTVIF